MLLACHPSVRCNKNQYKAQYWHSWDIVGLGALETYNYCSLPILSS